MVSSGILLIPDFRHTHIHTHTQGDGHIKLLPFPEDNENGLIVSNGSEVVCVEGILFIDQ